MSTPAAPKPSQVAPPAPPAPRWLLGTPGLRVAGLIGALVLVLLLVVLSIMVGSRTIAPGEVLRVLFDPDGGESSIIVHSLRLPRTALAVVVGIALGLAGAVMQALTRNPLADPGLLGVNAGAATAVVIGIGAFGAITPLASLPFAFVGAGLAAVIVYLLGSAGRSGATPVRLALAGTAVTAALAAVVNALTVLDPATFDQYRFWAVGSLAARGPDVLWPVLPVVVVGALLALALGPALNVLALGDDVGRSLGARVVRTRVLSGLVITLLAGAATAAVGPISFVGLAVPHIARALVGPDHRWVLAHSAVLAPALLLLSDVLGRVVVRPGELPVGIITAALGAPVFIALVRRHRVAQL
ncbi:FecCD family ABC transporter permease [Nakamurella leprariae]|uniref:Iron chelate uptake ABC transporter family permease subunit n=1 Tax=Nakamurella leprariae TaxID=2803911 RepID=A0A938YC84_9ACTN|nr:iron chelate uptake ABC transporter family permease subunit [Nakamurella leprariae]MBM9466941.1 iron chelate uptake ABC transporter family permease subunit [Nakamurella leprariae]